MPSMMAFIGANADPFRRELQAMQGMAARAGKNVQQSLGGNGAGHGATSGIIGESLVLLRELGRGNYARIPGSITILLQRMGLLNLVFRDTAVATQVLADGYSKLAAEQSLAAITATQKAAASQAAFYADVAETEATLNAAVADEAKAATARSVAAATMAKAEASQAAAAAAATEGTATIGALGMVGAVLVGLGIGLYAAIKLAGALKDRLASITMPDFHPEYIAKQLQAANSAAQGWKEIRREVDKAVDSYNSAAKAAERVSKATKDHFDHQRRMLELQKQLALAQNSKFPERRIAIEREFAARELRLGQQERQFELGNKITEQMNLANEAREKKRRAEAIAVPSEAHDAQVIAAAKAKADAAEKYLAESNASPDMFTKRNALRAYNKMALTGVTDRDLLNAEKTNRKQAEDDIAGYKAAVNRKFDNDELRRKKGDLQKAAEDSFAKAATTGLEIADLKKTNARKNAEEAAEARAKLAVEEVKERRLLRGNISSLQAVGAFVSPASILDVNKSMDRRLASIDRKMGTFRSTQTSRPFGEAHHG